MTVEGAGLGAGAEVREEGTWPARFLKVRNQGREVMKSRPFPELRPQ